MNGGICVIKVKVSLTMTQNHSDIKINNVLYSKITRPFVTRFCMFCAFTGPRYQMSVNRTVGLLVSVIYYSYFCFLFLFESVPLSLAALERLHYFTETPPGPSI